MTHHRYGTREVFIPGHEERVYSVDLAYHGVQDCLTIYRAGVEQDVKKGIIHKRTKLRNALQCKRLQSAI